VIDEQDTLREGGDEVFCDLVLARIIEPTSKADSLWVLTKTPPGNPRAL